MTNKERVREYIEQDQIYQDWKSGKLIDLSDFDKFCIDNCKAIEELLNEVEELHNKIDKAIEYLINPPKKIWEGHSIDEVVRILKGDVND